MTSAKCPKDGKPMAFVEVRILIDPKPSEFSGWLCAECRTIWSPTKVDEGIPLKMFT